MKTLLVTGASGFVGSSFMRRFAARQDLSLHGIGRRLDAGLPSQVVYHPLDLSQPFDLPLCPDVVIHAAARAAPWGTRAEFERQNIDATRHVIEFCRTHGKPRLIYLSSSSVFYQNRHQTNLHEDSPIGPEFVNLYAETKYAGELLVKEYEGEKTILRPRAVFGPGDTVLFPRILRAAREGKLPVFQTTTPAVGDLIYIDTLCDYIMRTCEAEKLAPAYNLTNAEPVRITDFLLKVLRELNLPEPKRSISINTAWMAAGIIEQAYRLLRLRGEPPVTRFGVSVFAYSKTFNPSRTISDLGLPSVSVSEGLRRFIAWQKDQPC